MGISVLMAVYENDDPLNFNEAIYSIWEQSLKPNQIVIIIDGKIGKAIEKVIFDWKIKLGKTMTVGYNIENRGLAKSLNKGLELCLHKYIARMDSDDISFKNRFKIEYEYLTNKKNVAMVGSWYNIYDEYMKSIIDKRELPEDFESIKKMARYRTPINHPTVIFKKDVALRVGGYPENIGRFEDWGFSLRFIRDGYVIENIPKNLLKFRGGTDLLSRRGGIKYLLEEYRALHIMYKMKLINIKDYLINIIIRTPVRLLPSTFRKKIYLTIRQTSQGEIKQKGKLTA